MPRRPTVWLSAEKGNLIVYAPAQRKYDSDVERIVFQIVDILRPTNGSAGGVRKSRTYWRIPLPQSATENMEVKKRLFDQIIRLFPPRFILSYRIGTQQTVPYRRWLEELQPRM